MFDSGIGGLTVVRALRHRLPNESIIYFGDTARVPYGTKSRRTVERYAVEDAQILLDRGVKMIVVACNTVSAVALESLRTITEIDVLGVIEPGARAATHATRSGNIGVIGTSATIASEAYTHAIHALNPKVNVFAEACPLFVPIVEEGWHHHEVARLAAAEYLAPLRDKIDTLVLGCTHYPLLKKTLADILGPSVTLIDSAIATADVVAEALGQKSMGTTNASKGEVTYLVSDFPQKFRGVAEQFLEETLGEVQLVSVDH